MRDAYTHEMQSLTVPHGEDIQDEKGRLFFRMLQPEVAYCRIEGHLSNELGKRMLEVWLAHDVGAWHVLYVDGDELESYDSDVRSSWTEFLRRFKCRIHITQRSKMVAMGVAVAKLALGDRIEQSKFEAFLGIIAAQDPQGLSLSSVRAKRAGG